VWSKEQPTADFVAATPNLEDVYFAALGQEEEQVYAEGMAMPKVG
jgi:hypothetical protein